MKVETRYYPHPVLSPFSDDIVNSSFRVDFNVDTSDMFYKFMVKFKLENFDLYKLIEEQKACFAIHVECSDSRMRDIFTSKSNNLEFEIPADKLNGKVEISFFVLALDNISEYYNEGFHEDYMGVTFSISKGDVLAVAEGQQFYADKENDDLKKIPSIFTVGINNEKDAPNYDVDYGQTNKIVIKLSNKTFEYYRELSKSNEMAKVLSSLLLLPALVSLIEQIKSSDFDYEQYEDSKWFRVIANRLLKLGIDIKNEIELTETSVVIAQKLIGDPLLGGLKDLFDTLTKVEE